jgi:hypothetical protein
MHDITKERRSGKLCTTSHGNPMIWRGHYCEGANLTTTGDNFCLWTMCGKHDVPANAAHEGRHREVTCMECAAAYAGPGKEEIPGDVWRNAETPIADNN